MKEAIMAADPNCIFCKIVAGEIPSFKLYEDAETLAFMDINPVQDGHCLVIPKAHSATVFEIAPDDFAAAARIAAKVAKAVNAVVSCDGINLMQANGEGAGQSVGHVHLHIIPRRNGDGLLFNWEPKPGERDRIAAVATRIRELL
jgi:histidine triad (HIT) family protein